MTDTTELFAALQAEYAAVYAYGIVAAYAAPARGQLIAEHIAAHRSRRDSTREALTDKNHTPPPPEPAYQPPAPVSNPISAAELAVTIETDAALAWRAVVEHGSTARTRRMGVDALTECALRLATWRSILGTQPATSAFPGKP